MELTRFDENDYSQGLSESPNGEWVRFADADAQINRLREALRAAEAECSEWRAEFATYGPDGQANDTIRANLGLPKIGGGQ